MSAIDHLTAIFDADRTLRDAEQDLLAADEAAVSEVLANAVDDATDLDDDEEKNMRLARLADLCAQVPGPDMVDALLAILDEELPSARVAAADALVDVAFERYAEVARGVERALARGEDGNMMGELPWVLAEVAEPSACNLIGRFLEQQDTGVVASAVEALASLGDPAATKLLEPMVNDERMVDLDDQDGEVSASLGELVQEALDMLKQGNPRDQN